MSAQKILAEIGVEYMAVFVPASESDREEKGLNWRIVLTSPYGNHEEFSYWQGIGHIPNVNTMRPTLHDEETIKLAIETGYLKKFKSESCRVPEPDPEDVISCLVMDAEALRLGPFEDWASTMGYDEDSRAAEKVYNACIEAGKQLVSIVGYTGMNTLSEFFQENPR